MKFSERSNLQQRLILGGGGVALGLFCIWISYTPYFGVIFTIFIAATILTALWEYYKIAEQKGYHPLNKIGMIGGLVYLFAVAFRAQMPAFDLMLPEVAISVTLVASFIYYFIKGSDPFVNLAITMFGILYLVIPLSYIIKINYFHNEPLVNDGRWCLIYLFFVTKITDTGAFFVGKNWGQRKFSPYISPKKTWEGALGGLFSAVLLSVLFRQIFQWLFDQPPFNLTLMQSLWLGTLISIAAQFGDLAESLLKRDVGIKDSSGLPGLGGFLDIVDSLIFTSPLIYLFLKLQSNPLL